MSSLDSLKKKVNELENAANEIYELALSFLENVRFFYDQPTLYVEIALSEENQRKAIRKYQQWFASTKLLITTFSPEWEDEFNSYYISQSNFYPGIRDSLSLAPTITTDTTDTLISNFKRKFESQVAILLSIPAVAEIRELNLRKIITADVARTEIEQAEILLTNGFERAAGSIAGVALELHLKTLCDINGVSYAPRATIQPLIQALQKAGKFDVTEVKNIEYLASIRNKCSHASNITETEIKTLIEGLKKLI